MSFSVNAFADSWEERGHECVPNDVTNRSPRRVIPQKSMLDCWQGQRLFLFVCSDSEMNAVESASNTTTTITTNTTTTTTTTTRMEEEGQEYVYEERATTDEGRNNDNSTGLSSSPSSSQESEMSDTAKAVVSAAALVGETVVESPRNQQKPSSRGINRHGFSRDQVRAMLARHDAHQRVAVSASTPTAATTPSSSLSWMQRGLWWWNRQRELAKQEELHRQVEEQRRKLVESEAMELLQLQQAVGIPPISPPAPQDALSSSLPSLGLSRKDTPFAPNLHDEDSNHYSNGHDKNNNNNNNTHTTTTLQRQQQDQQQQQQDQRVGLPECSQSGRGISVQASVDDDDDDSDMWIPDAIVANEDGQQDYGQDGAMPSSPSSEKSTTTANCNPFVLSQPQRQSLASLALPPGIMYCKWIRLYSLARDGDSFFTFLRKVHNRRHTLLVVRTTKGEILGGYADTAWNHHYHHKNASPEFFGSAQACLFQIRPNDQTATVYKWTGANRYIQYVDASNKMIAFGGGGGSFGLCVERDFQFGSTDKCNTFDNEPLCNETTFDIVDVECYGFLTGVF